MDKSKSQYKIVMETSMERLDNTIRAMEEQSESLALVKGTREEADWCNLQNLMLEDCKYFYKKKKTIK